jgi:hypothetical protein
MRGTTTKKSPRTVESKGGNSQQGLRLKVTQTSRKHNLLFSGLDRFGRVVNIYSGDVSELNVQHDSWCPALHGEKICHCSVAAVIHVMTFKGRICA